MSTFNFELKSQSYEIVVKKTQELLAKNDLENGMYYLNKAIDLSNELINNCIINELKNRYISENKKLKELHNRLMDNNNPFIVNSKVDSNPADNHQVKTEFFNTVPPNITLKDVAGLEKVKEEINLNVLIPIKHQDIYLKYKDNAGCQILMYGPPGCGKSFVAEAIAGELKCAYAVINAYDILDKYVGEAPKKIKQIFDEASKYDKCLIFFDELDVLFASRESDDSKHTKEVLTTFLTCLSGFSSNNNKNQVRIIIGATNRPWILDSALTRGKRFDIHIYIGLPDEDAIRFLIKKMYKNKLDIIQNTNFTIDDLVEKFKGYSCADIESILNQINSKALSRAVKNKENGTNLNEKVTIEDVDNVINSFRNSVTPEMIKAYEAYQKGLI